MDNQNDVNDRKKELVEVLIRIYKHLPNVISAVKDDNDRVLLQNIVNRLEQNAIRELYSLN